jgi:hypothetical protein
MVKASLSMKMDKFAAIIPAVLAGPAIASADVRMHIFDLLSFFALLGINCRLLTHSLSHWKLLSLPILLFF